CREIVEMPLESRHAALQRLDMVRSRIACGECRDFTFEKLPRSQQLERAGPRVPARTRGGLRLGHEDAGADAHLDEPAHFEGDDRLVSRASVREAIISLEMRDRKS